MELKGVSQTIGTESVLEVTQTAPTPSRFLFEDTKGVDRLGHLDLWGVEVSRRLDQAKRSTLGQFLTKPRIARMMASMLDTETANEISLLDPGAGIGSLFAAVVESCCIQNMKPKSINVTAYEIEPLFLDYLKNTVKLCESICKDSAIEFHAEIREEDFVASTLSMFRPDFSSSNPTFFTHAILNPPYHKIRSKSSTRIMLRSIGIETSNLYTAFLALASMLLTDGGQMVSITPRSFCNGPYFKPFRKFFLRSMNIEGLHLFQSRQDAFREDDVLQENLITVARKGEIRSPNVVISSSFGAEDDSTSFREVSRSEVVSPEDRDSFIHIVTDEIESQVAKLGTDFASSLNSLGLQVSTGRVVDFRAKAYITAGQKRDTVPLIYPAHFERGFVCWPKEGMRKPDTIMVDPETNSLLVSSGNYVLVRRFSAKEEPRRIVAAIYDASQITAPKVGFENHLNYFHADGKGMNIMVAKGLAVFLNSTFVDTLFRNFSGHTQVNASDLRKLKYPTLQELESLGQYVGSKFPEQEELDQIFEKELLHMAEEDSSISAISAKKKIQEALQILQALGLPRAQQNERSALTLIALLDLKPTDNWSDASSPLCGITPMMEFFSKYYGKSYKPNTRETVRRQTVHQFLAAGFITENPDDPTRPINSPKAVYQIEHGALELLRTFGTTQWEAILRTYLESVQTLRQRYAREREMQRIPVKISEDREILLSPGGQNILIKQIIEEFGSRFTPGGQLVYVGDTDEKFAFFDDNLLKNLGVNIETHGKMPDIIIYYKERNWLVLIEAVTSHGPVDPKRRDELQKLFHGSSADLVFVTAFLTRRAMVEYLNDISWETEVWVAEAPSHLIHFNGKRFLGPYDN